MTQRPFCTPRCTATLAGAIVGSFLVTLPAAATEEPDLEQMPERLEGMIDEMMDRMRPALDDFFGLLGVVQQIDDPRNYGQPVILPNGDILIPREPDAPDWSPEWGDEEPDFKPGPDSPVPGIRT